MKRWYPRIFSIGQHQDADLFMCLDAADAYEEVYEVARSDLIVDGRIEAISARLPGLSEQRFAQLQDIESILEYLETRSRVKMVEKTKYYMEHYQRTLSDRVAKDYAEVSTEVQTVNHVLQRVAYVRNLFLGISKGFEYMQYQISNVTKLRCAGLEDATIDGRRHH